MRGAYLSPFRHFPLWLAVLIVVLVTLPVPAAAQAPTTVMHTFKGYSSAEGPAAPLMQASDGNFYGTTKSHGRFQAGTVFRMTPGGTVRTIYDFPGGADASSPNSALVQGPDGALYGTTAANFYSDNISGTVFRMTLSGQVTILHRFDRDTEGVGPGRVILATDGFFYGIASPASHFSTGGMVFRMTAGGAVTVLHSFSGGPTDGSYPTALVQGADGNFYGTTAYGGTTCPHDSQPACLGTLFRMTPAGAITILHSFLGGPGDGAQPSDLIQASNGSLYGVTPYGGGSGTLFEWTPAGQYRALTTWTGEGGQYPFSLMQARDGRLFGVASDSVFTIASDGSVRKLHSFPDQYENPFDGDLPQSLVQGADGRLYGATTRGGISNFGTVFRMELDGRFAVLHQFLGSVEGVSIRHPLVEARDGNLYGATRYGGLFNAGTIFRMTPGGVMTTLYTFTRGLDGAFPSALIQASDGFLYGTTSANGASNQGTIFRISTGGAFTVKHAFVAPGPSVGAGALVQATDGNLYGATVHGGPDNSGTVYRMTLTGQVTLVHQFTGYGEYGYVQRDLALLQATDGGLYGVGNEGMFRVGLTGGLSELHTPYVESLVQAADGNFYGARRCYGEILRLSPTGASIVVAYTNTQCSDYDFLVSGTSLTAGRDGALYGTLYYANDRSMNMRMREGVFSLTRTGDVIPLHQPHGTQDATSIPRGVMQARNGMLYGISGYDLNTIFRVNLAVPRQPVLVATPTAGGVRLTWAGTSGVARFTLTRRIGSGPAVVIASGLTTTTFTEMLAVSPGVEVRYTVVALNASGQSLSSESALPWGAIGSQTPTVSTVGDYDGDGVPDLTVYRTTTGEWFTALSANRRPTSTTWGGGRPAPADYDGDGRTDLAIYNAVGQWLIRRSNTFPELWAPSFGAPALGDLPVPADYDGDGKADLAVYRASTGEWFVLRSTTNTVQRWQWGAAALGDLPVPGDYDGDGRADIAVYRGTTGEWFIDCSATGTTLTVTWGAPALGDVPVPADYDGDGDADFAVYRATTGEWFVADASGQPVRTAWGLPGFGDAPVPADYDGDGKADLAVYRLSAGRWYILQSDPSASPYWDDFLAEFGFGSPADGDVVRAY